MSIIIGLIIIIIITLLFYVIINKNINKSIEQEINIDNTEKKSIETSNEINTKDIEKIAVLPDVFKEIEKIKLKEIIDEEIVNLSQEYGMEFEETKELIDEVINQVNENKELIYKYIEEENWEELEKIIHSLKGATLNSKFNTIGKRFEYILDYTRTNQENIDKNYLKELINNTYKTLEEIIKII